MWWSASRRSRRLLSRRPRRLLDHFTLVDAPELLLLDVALEAVDADPAPAAIAVRQIGDDARFDHGHGSRAFAVVVPQRDFGRRLALLDLPRQDQRRAPAGQERLQNPARGAVGVAHLAPALELLDHLE